jgi:hypothetical protein
MIILEADLVTAISENFSTVCWSGLPVWQASEVTDGDHCWLGLEELSGGLEVSFLSNSREH